MNKNLIAAIDIGSRAVRMKIGELSKNGKFRELDSFSRSLVLGHDTFLYKRINFAKVDMLCEVLSNYKQIIDEYKIVNYSLMATSAIREARNKDYIIDQIRIRTGLKAKVLASSEEQFLTLKGIRLNLDNFDSLASDGVIVVGIGGGSIQVTGYKDTRITSNTNLNLGSLRIKELLSPIKEKNLKYRDVLKEYTSLYLGKLGEDSDKKYKHLVVVGGEIDLICDITASNKGMINKKDILKLYKEIEHLSDAEIVDRYRVDSERASVLFPALVLLKQFVKMVDSEEVIVPELSLVDGIVRNLYEGIYSLSLDEYIIEDVLNSARNLAGKYMVNEEHFYYVDDLSCQLFKKLARAHGLKEEILYLRLAAILSEVGASVNISEYGESSYELIRMLDVFGMSKESMEIVALVSKFAGELIPDNTDMDFATVPDDEHITVAKLIGIIKLAASLDVTLKQKLRIKSIKFKERLLLITATSNVDTSLEEWDFALKSEYFKEVFGIDTKLIVKREF